MQPEPAIQTETVRDRGFAARWTAVVLTLILLAGVGLRAGEFWQNRSLNHDEACLAHSILHKPFSELAGRLDYAQAAPVGFLFLERAAFLALGGGEAALRTVALLFSIATLLLLALLCARMLNGVARLVAVGCIACSQPLVVAAAWAKQYSGETFFTLVALGVAVLLFSGAARTRSALVYSVVLGVCLWLSYPSVFLVSGLLGACALSVLFSRDWRRLRAFLPLFLITGSSLAAFALVSMAQARETSRIMEAWPAGSLPLNNASVLLDRLGLAAWDIGRFTTTDRLGTTTAVLAGIGFVSLLRRMRWPMTAMLLAVLACVAASFLGKYPLASRMLFFLVPVSAICVGEAVRLTLDFMSQRARACAAAVLATIFVYMGGSTAHHRLYRSDMDDPRGLLAAVAAQWRGSDVLYLSPAAAPSFTYYGSAMRLPPARAVTTRPPQAQSRPASAPPIPSDATRIWFVFWDWERNYDRSTLARYGLQGERSSLIIRPGYVAALWSLSAAEPLRAAAAP